MRRYSFHTKILALNEDELREWAVRTGREEELLKALPPTKRKKKPKGDNAKKEGEGDE